MKEIKAKPPSMEVPWFIKEIEELKLKVEAYKKLARDMEETVDNVRASLGLDSTHYLIIADQVAEVVEEREKLKEKVRRLQSEIVLSDGIIDSINQILEGNEVSDFALSFGIVRDVYDLYHSKIKKENQLRNERDALIITLKDIVSIWEDAEGTFEESGERIRDLAAEMSDEWEI